MPSQKVLSCVCLSVPPKEASALILSQESSACSGSSPCVYQLSLGHVPVEGVYEMSRTAVLVSVPTWQPTQMYIRRTELDQPYDNADDDLTQDAFAIPCAGPSF